MKTVEIKSAWSDEVYKVFFYRDSYESNNRLFLGLGCVGEGYCEPYADVTVNIPEAFLTGEDFEDCAFVDTNNMPNIVSWLESNGFAKRTGMEACSGYCRYPEMKFDFEKIKPYMA